MGLLFRGCGHLLAHTTYSLNCLANTLECSLCPYHMLNTVIGLLDT